MAKSTGANRRNEENKINPGILITLILVGVLCVFMLGYSLVDSMGVLDRNTTAITVGEDEVSVIELNQYYHTARNGFLNQYGSMLSMYGYSLDASFDLQPSMFDTTMTWKEYFMEQAKEAAVEVSVLYQEAKKNGYTMTAQDQEQFDLYMDSLEAAAEEYDMSVSKYCKLLYGSGTKLSDVKDYYTKRVLTAGYYNTVLEGFNVTDTVIDAYYEQNQDEYDELNYFLYDVKYETLTYDAASTEEGAPKSEAEAKQKTEENKAQAKKEAEELLAQLKADGSNFDEICAAHSGEEDFATAEASSVVSTVAADSPVGEWLLAEGRKTGDKGVIDDEGDSSMTLMLYMDRALRDDYTVAVRHALVAFESAESGATEEEIAAVETANQGKKAEAEALYEQWKSAGATEDAFIQLAKDHSADGNAAQGGLYEGVYEGQMTKNFEDWCFDETRAYGDHGIVETEYGYHIMFFVENEGLAYRSDIKDSLEQEKYSEYFTALKDAMTITYSDKAISLM